MSEPSEDDYATVTALETCFGPGLTAYDKANLIMGIRLKARAEERERLLANAIHCRCGSMVFAATDEPDNSV